MEPTILEALVLPWWKIVAYIGAIALAVITIRITVKFDVNTWLESRRDAKAIKELRKRAETCRHLWTLYRSSQYSLCNQCTAVIATSTLLIFQNHPDVFTAGEISGMQIVTGKGQVLVESPIGSARR